MLESDTTHLVHPGHDSERHIARRLKLLLVVFLAALSIAYLAKGFFYGIFLNGEGSDVLRRWLEERFVLGEHIDPRIAADFARRGVVYPPWSYFAGLFMFWPPWPQVRVWFALINFASLIWIVRFVAAYARDQPRLDRILLVLSVTAIGATCTTIGVGNYPVIAVALLIGAYQAEQAGRPVLSGLLMGLALLKPQLSGPFLLVALVRGRFRALTAAAIYVIGATIAICAISGVNPVRMLEQSVGMTEAYANTTAGLLTLVLDLGVPYRLAAPLTAIVCLAIFTSALWNYRKRSLMLLFAIAAVMSRLWTYNLNTSNLILIFLLLALWRLAIETRDMRAIALFLAVGVSLWVPAGLSEHHAVQLAEHLIWLGGLIGLLILDHRSVVSEELEVPNPIAGATDSHGSLPNYLSVSRLRDVLKIASTRRHWFCSSNWGWRKLRCAAKYASSIIRPSAIASIAQPICRFQSFRKRAPWTKRRRPTIAVRTAPIQAIRKSSSALSFHA